VNLGLVLEQCLAPVPGGTGRYSRELAVALAATAPEGARVSGVTARHHERLQIDGIRMRRLPLPRRGLVAAWERGAVPAVPGDVVHALTPLHPRKGSAPLVVTVHDGVPWTHPETLTPRGVRWHRHMVGRAVATADLVVTPTQATADTLARHLDLRDVLVAGGGVSPDLVVPADAADRAAAWGLPDRYLLTVATVEPRKGLRELIMALRGLPDVPLVSVGQPGWGRLELTQLVADTGVDVTMLGRVSDPDLAVLLSRASALVVPSYDEGFGLPLLEGMALGTPVLTSDAPALVEVAGGAALSVPLPALREGILAILDDDELASRLREEGPRRAAEFSWERTAGELWKAYARLV
jgi:glycosyltransferase involved in cell wall biosynthesis